MKVIKAPGTLPVIRRNGVVPHSLFLAGSISEDWQTDMTKRVETDVRGCEFLFNPRRYDWNPAWHTDSVEFKEQVSWEMTALDMVKVIVMYFDPATKSPISLLELGLHATSGKMVVCCPNGFWRKGNVEIVCNRFDIPLFHHKPTDESCIRHIEYMLNT